MHCFQFDDIRYHISCRVHPHMRGLRCTRVPLCTTCVRTMYDLHTGAIMTALTASIAHIGHRWGGKAILRTSGFDVGWGLLPLFISGGWRLVSFYLAQHLHFFFLLQNVVKIHINIIYNVFVRGRKKAFKTFLLY